MNAYLSTLTVPVLKEIAKRMGFILISRKRKAELVALIAAHIEWEHSEAIREDKIRTRQASETPYTGKRTIAAIKADGVISRMDYPVPYGRPVTEAHVKICNEYGHVSYVVNNIDQGSCPRCGEVTTSEEQITKEEIDSEETVTNPVNVMRMSHSDPIDDVIRFATEAIEALMPNLAATKLAFETLRDDESANPNHVDLAYQVYSDTHRAIEEYRRTIAYASDEHTCATWEREIGMSGCSYGCKIYGCEKCGESREVHNPIYGCRGK